MNDRCIHLLLENQEYILELVCLNILKINEWINLWFWLHLLREVFVDSLQDPVFTSKIWKYKDANIFEEPSFGTSQ